MARGGDREREPQERAYSDQRQERMHQMRGNLRHMQDRLREMEDHLPASWTIDSLRVPDSSRAFSAFSIVLCLACSLKPIADPPANPG